MLAFGKAPRLESRRCRSDSLQKSCESESTCTLGRTEDFYTSSFPVTFIRDPEVRVVSEPLHVRLSQVSAKAVSADKVRNIKGVVYKPYKLRSC